MKRFFPFFIDISNKTFLIIGGGKIAARRVNTLTKFDTNIIVIAPDISEELTKIDYNKISFIKREYKKEDITDRVDFVLAATDSEIINTEIVGRARIENIPVNNCKNKAECDFYFPAIVEDKELIVGVCASGMSHKKAAFTKRLIDKTIKESIFERESIDDK